MTLKRANLIAALIADLDDDCKVTDYVAEVELVPDCVNEYSVKLSSKAGHHLYLSELFCFARELMVLGVKLHMNVESNYIKLS